MWNVCKSVVFVSCELTLLACLMGLLIPSLMAVSSSHRKKLARLLALAPMGAFILAAAVSVARQEAASARAGETSRLASSGWSRGVDPV